MTYKITFDYDFSNEELLSFQILQVLLQATAIFLSD